jgi:succinoglycan biosynthesis transport protein ExoP
VTVTQFLLALRARLGVFALALGFALLAALGATMIMKKTYVAGSSVLVDGSDQQSLGNNGGSARGQTGYMQTQVDIIASRKVAERVAEQLRLKDRPGMQKKYQDDTEGLVTFEEWAVRYLRDRLAVDTSQSSVIHLIFSANDRQLAADGANAYAQQYMNTTLELRTQPLKEAASWFDEQLKELRSNLEKAQGRFAAAQNEKGVMLVDGVDEESARFAELSRQLRLAQNQGVDGSPANPELINNPEIAALKGEVAKAEAKLRELSTRIGPRHPQYQTQVAEIAGLKDRLSQETGRAVRGRSGSASANRDRVARLQAAVDQQRERVLRSRLSRSDLSVLQRDVENAQKSYDTALQRFVVNKVDGNARQTNVSLLSAAVAPIAPAKPKPMMNVLLALIGGTVLGLGLVYLLEMLDRRVRARGDLEGAFRTPVLAVLEDRPPTPRLPLLGYRPEMRPALPYRR